MKQQLEETIVNNLYETITDTHKAIFETITNLNIGAQVVGQDTEAGNKILVSISSLHTSHLYMLQKFIFLHNICITLHFEAICIFHLCRQAKVLLKSIFQCLFFYILKASSVFLSVSNLDLSL